VETVEFDHSHISGGLSKIQTADNVIGIFTSTTMRERGRVQLQFMKTRSSSAVGTKIELEFNVTSLRITDLGEDSADAPTTVDVMTERLKRSSTTIDKDTGEVIEKKTEPTIMIRGMGDNSKLVRDILKK
jgi:hypothetical protein